MTLLHFLEVWGILIMLFLLVWLRNPKDEHDLDA